MSRCCENDAPDHELVKYIIGRTLDSQAQDKVAVVAGLLQLAWRYGLVSDRTTPGMTAEARSAVSGLDRLLRAAIPARDIEALAHARQTIETLFCQLTGSPLERT